MAGNATAIVVLGSVALKFALNVVLTKIVDSVTGASQVQCMTTTAIGERFGECDYLGVVYSVKLL